MAPPSDPMITAAAELRMRQVDADFMGWVYDSAHSKYASLTCDAGLSFYIGPTYVDCCPLTYTTCNPPAGCGAGTLLYTYPPSGTRTTTLTSGYPCTSQAGTGYPYCGTAFFFEYLGAPNQKTEFFCDTAAEKYSIYRSQPAVSTPTPTPKPTPSSTPIPSPNISPSPLPPPTPTPTPSKSKAWIAGAVVGPLLGLALIGALLFFLLHRRKKNHSADTPQTGGATMAQAHTPAGVGGYTDMKPGFNSTPVSPVHQETFPHQQQQQQQYAHNAGAPVSPVPPYSSPGAYSAPYQQPPPPQQGYAPEYNNYQPGAHRASEIG